jgi:hypothetical protein
LDVGFPNLSKEGKNNQGNIGHIHKGKTTNMAFPGTWLLPRAWDLGAISHTNLKKRTLRATVNSASSHCYSEFNSGSHFIISYKLTAEVRTSHNKLSFSNM